MQNELNSTQVTDLTTICDGGDLNLRVPPSRPVVFPPTRPLRARPLTRGFSSIPWPRVGGEDLVVMQTDIFLTEAFRDLFGDGDERRTIYVAGCHGVRDLARALGHPIYKVSCTSPSGVWRRMQELRNDSYGAAWHRDGEPVEDLNGWNGWFASQISTGYRPPSPGAPVEVDARSITVTLPLGMSPEEFDERFDRRVASACLADWSLSAPGLAYGELLGLDLQRFRRHTPYASGDVARLSPAREICLFSIFDDGDRLVQIAEEVVLEHLGLPHTSSEPTSD